MRTQLSTIGKKISNGGKQWQSIKRRIWLVIMNIFKIWLKVMSLILYILYDQAHLNNFRKQTFNLFTSSTSFRPMSKNVGKQCLRIIKKVYFSEWEKTIDQIFWYLKYHDFVVFLAKSVSVAEY